MAQSRGAFFVNNASVPGTATILDGTAVQTTTTSSDVRLRTGERLTLASNSSATVYRDHVVLETGMAEVNPLSTYRLETRNLRIGAATNGALVRVGLESGNQVKVFAVTGTAEVFNTQGMLVARVFPGTALQLQSVAAVTTSTLTGTIRTKDGKFFLTDETTKVKVELQGNWKKLVGKHVHVTGAEVAGAKPAGDASEVFAVTSEAEVGAAAAGLPATATPAVAGAATGLSTAATVAIVGGVAAAATVGGLAAAGTIGGSSSAVSR